jgi:hypothetical protein
MDCLPINSPVKTLKRGPLWIAVFEGTLPKATSPSTLLFLALFMGDFIAKIWDPCQLSTDY